MNPRSLPKDDIRLLDLQYWKNKEDWSHNNNKRKANEDVFLVYLGWKDRQETLVVLNNFTTGEFAWKYLHHCGEHRNEESYNTEQEYHEIVVIVYTDTIIDPRAVMVKAFHTLIADTAMARSLGSYDLAVWAKQNWVKIFKHSLLISLDQNS